MVSYVNEVLSKEVRTETGSHPDARVRITDDHPYNGIIFCGAGTHIRVAERRVAPSTHGRSPSHAGNEAHRAQHTRDGASLAGIRDWVPTKIANVLLPLGTLEPDGVAPNGTGILAPRVNAMIAPVTRSVNGKTDQDTRSSQLSGATAKTWAELYARGRFHVEGTFIPHPPVCVGQGAAALADRWLPLIVSAALRPQTIVAARQPFLTRQIVGRYVIMPDHVHLFVRGDRSFTLSSWIGGLKRAMCVGLKLPCLWQPGFFDHILRSDESYAEKWNYVRNNPVRAGLARTADEWPYQGEIAVIDRA